MSLISLIQQLQTIQAQLSSPKFNAGEFGHLSQRYAALCASSVSVLQANQEKASASAAPQDLDPDLSLCSSSKLEHNLFLFQDRVKEFARQSAAAAEQLLPKSKPQPYSPPCSPVKRLLKAPSAPSTPASQLATLMQGRLALDASAAAVLKNPEYLQTQITALKNAISSKIAELSSLLEAERRKFQTKIQGFFPDDASQESAELAGDLFDIFYSTDQGEGALLQKVVYLIAKDVESNLKDEVLLIRNEAFIFKLNPKKNFNLAAKKSKKNEVYFKLDSQNSQISYVFFHDGIQKDGTITGELYREIIEKHKANNEAITAQKAKNRYKVKPECELRLNETVLNTLKENILSFIFLRMPDIESSYREKAMPQCLKRARVAILQKNPEVFESLGRGLSNDPCFYFNDTREAKNLAELFFKEFNMLEGNAEFFENFQLEKHKDIVLRRANKVQKLDSDFAVNEKGLLEEAVTALNQKPIGIVFDYLQLAPDSAAAQAHDSLMREIEGPSPICLSFFLLEKKDAGKEKTEKICLVTVSGELSKLQGSTRLYQEIQEKFQTSITNTVQTLNKKGNQYQYQFKYHEEEKLGVDLVIDQLNKVISGECKPLDVNSLNLQNPSRACAEKKMIAYWIAQLKDKKVDSLKMEGSANFFRSIDPKKNKFVPCCEDCKINKIPVLIFFKHLQDKKAKSMTKQPSDRVPDEAAVADAAFAAARPTMPLSLLSRRLSADADAATVDEAKSGKQQKGRKLCFS